MADTAKGLDVLCWRFAVSALIKHCLNYVVPTN